MDPKNPASNVFKAIIAPARHSDGPTLYLICQLENTGQYEIHEHLPDGTCTVWPEPPVTGPQQAEAAIYGWSSVKHQSTTASVEAPVQQPAP